MLLLVQPANIKLVKKIARLAYGICKKKESHVVDGTTLSSRAVLLHAAALIVFKALNFKLPSQSIDEIFRILDLLSYVRIDDYYELTLDVPIKLSILI